MESKQLPRGAGHITGCRGRVFADHTIYYGVFIRRNKGGEKEGSRRFGDEQVWENRAMKGDSPMQTAGRSVKLTGHALHLINVACSALIKLLFQLLPAEGLSVCTYRGRPKLSLPTVMLNPRGKEADPETHKTGRSELA